MNLKRYCYYFYNYFILFFKSKFIVFFCNKNEIIINQAFEKKKKDNEVDFIKKKIKDVNIQYRPLGNFLNYKN